ncbi:hypothetical protein SH661x_001792 [Planctomicrobium sp. SH661]|uniref:hypothetical protein n=1 Tax=Planctomicrobium sp. SH661 TaxID=3448124 RepID=UPI003F5ADF67
MMKPVEHLQLSPRVALRPGDQFRTTQGSGPLFGGKHHLGPFSTFRLLQLEANRTRIYATAMDVKNGTTHTLYVSGPRYKTGDTVFIPFKVRKVK